MTDPGGDSTLREFCSEMEHSIVERYRKSRSKSLRDVYEMDHDFREVDSRAVGFIADNREKILGVLSDAELYGIILDVFVSRAMEFSLRSNQFFPFDADDRAILEKLYRRYLDDMRGLLTEERSLEELSAGMRQLLEDHFRDLSDNVARYLDPSSGGSFIFARPVCNEYSPELQMEALGIDTRDLRQPILDIGCGYSGNLVRYLNARGFKAVGVDREVGKSEFLIRMDWFEACDGRERWGTVISHMAFSNHFIFHDAHSMGNPSEYAVRYKAILSSLLPGGSFYYTPGLPFIERYLSPDEYRLTKRVSSISSANEAALASTLGYDALYSARVQRKG